jgi:voltage-gated potassium channel
MLEAPERDGSSGRLLDGALILLIMLNLIAVVLESVPDIRQDWHPQFHVFEIFSIGVFSVEYLLRLWCSAENPDLAGHSPVGARLRYMITPLAVVDLLAILPFYLSLLIGIDLRFLRALRLLRVFKLTRYFSAMGVLLDVLREEARAFGAAVFVLLVIMILASSGMYLFEHQAQPEAFGSIPAAMWWAVATLTTVGYGDVTPITVGGKVFGACITIIGIGMVALPAGILASGFSDHLHARRQRFQQQVDRALSDGIISEEEHARLELSRESLSLSTREANQIREQSVQQHQATDRLCPCCKRPLGHPE